MPLFYRQFRVIARGQLGARLGVLGMLGTR